MLTTASDALGVRADDDGTATTAELEQLIVAHLHTRGAGFVAPGTPTNNTASEKAGFSPRDPELTTRPPALADQSDFLRFSRALPSDELMFLPSDITQEANAEAWIADRSLRTDHGTAVMIRKRVGASLIALRASNLVVSLGEPYSRTWRL